MYYVYHLIDPRDGKVFYVGKGKGHRIDRHEVEAANGVYSRKCNLIRAILADGQQVGKRFVARFDDELHAYAAEKIQIACIGLANLTNVNPGGIYLDYRSVPEKPAFRWTAERLAELAPRMAKALWLIATTGGLMVCGEEMTDTVVDIAKQMIVDLGRDIFRKAMNDQGLNIKLA